ncbi:hypothetical protein SLEP1_g59034 [Rubroshorea leprosula]|uniref:SNF2 N-terminal domain-containing protein n=1 Tax=Rubroshorea leprosula TaxID=152421 RepID=A0AAV5MSD2_9ROSI|nr:hypothetical protein SLEP1_g59034 [Rubroshorea leprosula]
MVKRAIIVTPTSLVSNWEAKIKKWMGERVKLIALCESTRDDVLSGIDGFMIALQLSTGIGLSHANAGFCYLELQCRIT